VLQSLLESRSKEGADINRQIRAFAIRRTADGPIEGHTMRPNATDQKEPDGTLMGLCAYTSKNSDYAHALTFGRGIGFPDYERADTIVLWGHNPERTWLAQASRRADAKRRRDKVAVIDPKPEGSGQLADLWLRIRPGADAALAMAVVCHLIFTETFDRDFVARWTMARF
jgi:anaerobic selenocysteine-containing dehydrogenase